jgi:hypothetical protein
MCFYVLLFARAAADDDVPPARLRIASTAQPSHAAPIAASPADQHRRTARGQGTPPNNTPFSTFSTTCDDPGAVQPLRRGAARLRVAPASRARCMRASATRRCPTSRAAAHRTKCMHSTPLRPAGTCLQVTRQRSAARGAVPAACSHQPRCITGTCSVHSVQAPKARASGKTRSARSPS